MRHHITQAVGLLVVGALIFILTKWSAPLFIFLGALIQLLGIFISFRLLFVDKRGTNSKVAWILVIFILPVVGTLIYLMLGRNPQTRQFQPAQISEVKKIIDKTHQNIEEPGVDAPELSMKLAHLSEIMPLSGNNIEILTNGDASFKAKIEALKQAKDHIHIQYYIYRMDAISKEIRDILIEKSKEGVEVRFLYDGLGSHALKDEFLMPMIEANIKVYAYDPVFSPWVIRTANLRNHRKIIVIDGQVGFTGGLNIGEEYRSNTADFHFWRDTHIKITGLAVKELQESFINDWVYVLNTKGSADHFINEAGYRRYFSPIPVGDEWAQVIYGGPYDEERIVRDSMLDLIDSAQESVWLLSPYFVPDDESLAVIRRVAMSGIDVRIILPGKGDRGISFHGSNAYIDTMLDAGAKVYAYDKESFIHAKLMIVDGNRAAVGTANFDVRSFRLNHELMVFLYDETEAIKHLITDFKQDLSDSKLYTKKDMENKAFMVRLKESLSSLLSPIL